MHLIPVALALLAASFLASALLCWIVRGLARRFDFVDLPGERKIHTQPIALGGGVAFFLVTTLAVLAAALFALIASRSGAASWLPQILLDNIPRAATRAQLVFFVLAGGTALFVLGLLDDFWGLSPWVRLAIQAAVAVLLWTFSPELRITAFVTAKWFSLLVTVGWIVAITNAFNLLDNMDGLSAGVALIAAASFAAVAILTEQYFVAAMLLIFIGSLAGFLLFNFPPASMFMGDAGSMFIGYTLAVLTILTTFYVPGHGFNPVSSVVTPLVILAVPIYDTLSVVIIRLSLRKPIFVGDKNHFSHRLVALGMGHRGAVTTIYLVTLCTGLLAPLFLHIQTWQALLILANVALMLVLIWVLEHVGRHGRSIPPSPSTRERNVP